MSHEKQMKIFNKLVNERALQVANIKDKLILIIDPYKFSVSGNNPKDFGNYQIPLI